MIAAGKRRATYGREVRGSCAESETKSVGLGVRANGNRVAGSGSSEDFIATSASA
jgi:hypothetical protein